MKYFRLSLLFVILVVVSATYSSATAYVNVSLTLIANMSEDLNTPKGWCEMGGVPFYFPSSGNSYALTEDEHWTQFPTNFHLTTSIDSPQEIYVLYACHYCYLGYRDQMVGKLVFSFEGGENQEVPLIAGYNIRGCIEGSEWLNTTSSSDVQEVWTGSETDGRNASLDMLTIQAPNCTRLIGIDIVDTSAQTTIGGAAGIGLRGITVQTIPEPSSLFTLLCGIGGIGGLACRRRKA